MPTEKFGRRAEDNGKESPMNTLVRIDENIKFLKSGAELVRIQLNEHEKQDDKKFKENDDKLNDILKNIYIASGGCAVIIFIINWFHK